MGLETRLNFPGHQAAGELVNKLQGTQTRYYGFYHHCVIDGETWHMGATAPKIIAPDLAVWTFVLGEDYLRTLSLTDQQTFKTLNKNGVEGLPSKSPYVKIILEEHELDQERRATVANWLAWVALNHLPQADPTLSFNRLRHVRDYLRQQQPAKTQSVYAINSSREAEWQHIIDNSERTAIQMDCYFDLDAMHTETIANVLQFVASQHKIATTSNT